MKKLPLLAGLALLFLATILPSLRSEIIGVEQFDYPDSPIAEQNGGIFWDFRNITAPIHDGTQSEWINTFGAPVVAGGRLITDDTSAQRPHNGFRFGLGFGSTPPGDEELGAVTDIGNRLQQVVYYRVSFTTGATLPDFLGLNISDFDTNRLFFGKRSGQGVFGILTFNDFGSVDSTLTVEPNTTYTLVAKIDYPNNSLSLFVNPILGAGEPTPNAVLHNYTTNNFSTRIGLDSGSGGAVAWDNLVAATSWQELGTVVTTTADEDDGSLAPTANSGGGTGVSLREAVNYASSGSLVTFAPILDGGTITFTGGEMSVFSALTIDASSLPHGLTLDAGKRSRHFTIQGGQPFALIGLTLVNGNGTATFGSDGGAIFNFNSPLRLTRCTLDDNSGSNGGAIFHQGLSCLLDHCTITGNHCTGSFSTGAIYCLAGKLTLTHCTIVGNTGNGFGGGVYWQTASPKSVSPVSVEIGHSIIAGNTDAASTHPDLFNNDGPNATVTGPCLIGVNDTVDTTFPAGPLVGTTTAPINPKLAPLADNGGPTRTMALLAGSPAINAATGSTATSDQRGFPTVGVADIGAFEFQPTPPPPPPPPAKFRISLKSSPGRFGSVQGAGVYLTGTRISVKAIPKTGRKFVKWMEGKKTVSTKRTLTFQVTKSRSLVAMFK